MKSFSAISLAAVCCLLGGAAVLHGSSPPSRAVSGVHRDIPGSYPDYPDGVLTPGAVRTTDRASICNTATSTIRFVSASTKRAVYNRYGLDPYHHEPCEVDHLISLELGGSNDVSNLWPQHYSEPWGAHDKDVLENTLHRFIVAGHDDEGRAYSVQQAQHDIATDWVGAYKKYVKRE